MPLQCVRARLLGLVMFRHVVSVVHFVSYRTCLASCRALRVVHVIHSDGQHYRHSSARLLQAQLGSRRVFDMAEGGEQLGLRALGVCVRVAPRACVL